MQRFYFSRMLILVALLGWNLSGSAQTVTSYSYSSSTPYYTYTVPQGVFSLTLDVQGANGGNANCSGNAQGGGRVECTLQTTPGSVLYFYVGGCGANYVCCGVNKGGYNGGGDGNQYGGGGGGATDVRTAIGDLSSRIIVAGGGGGGGYNCCNLYGGKGGGLTGGDGLSCSGSDGRGGRQNGGGAGGTYSGTGSPGTFGTGGNCSSGAYGGGGGGGGYWGGGGGSGYGGGGGGSSYTDGSLVSGVNHTPGYNTGCGAVTFTANCTPPTTGVIGGNTSVCIGLTTTMSTTASAGGSWSSTNIAVGTVNPTTGVVTGISAGTTTISYSIVYTCGAVNLGKVITVNPLPAPITGANLNACLGLNTTLSDATPGGRWSSSNTTIVTVGSTNGIVTGVAVGNANISYKLTATGCYAILNETVNALPTKYVTSVDAPGNYCSGGVGLHVRLSSTDANISYQLYKGSTPDGTAVVGSGAPLDFGLRTAAGTYKVIATDLGTACPVTMLGTPALNVTPLPTQYAVTTPGGASYCASVSGVDLQLAGSDIGVSYDLYNGASLVASMPGTGSSLDFGTVAAGTYNVVGTDGTTSCSGNMSNTVTVVMNALPAVYNVTGGGSYCSMGAGVRDTLMGSDIGIDYELYLSSAPTGNIKSGTGSVLDFGLITAPGTYTIVAKNTTTNCTSLMAGTAVVAISPLPTLNTVSSVGGTSYCPGDPGKDVTLSFSDLGVNYQLYNGLATVGGTMSGSGTPLDFGFQPAGSYTVKATNATTGCSATMLGTANITINTLPTVHTVTGGGAYCAGGAGKVVNLSGSDLGVNYQLLQGGLPAVGVSLVTGTGSSIGFGSITAAGNYTVKATDAVTGCTNMMGSSVNVVVNPLPNTDTVSVTSNGAYCAGGTGVNVMLNNSVSGTNYQLYLNGVALTDPAASLSGSGSGLDFGARTTTGIYTVGATIAATGCTSMMYGGPAVSINPLPLTYSVSGGGAYCAGGSGSHVGLSFSDVGVSYQLIYGSSPLGLPLLGSGAPLDFGVKTGIGSYVVVATNVATGCISTMSGAASVSSTPLPTNYTVTGGGSYCATLPGVPVGLSASNAGINYQLYNGTIPVGGTVHGTGYALNFGLQTLSGSYSVVATNASTGCMNNMAGTVNVNVNPMPNAYSVTGGGAYCSGSAGVNVGLGTSDAGINYQLYFGTAPQGSAVPGSGSPIDFGVKTAAGSYTIKATDALSGCTTWMSGSANVIMNSLPNKYTVTGGGAYCAGSTGYHVTLSGSDAGVDYQLMNSLAVGSPMSGSGIGLDFGTQSASGTYTVIGTDVSSGCSSTMMGNAKVTVNPTPAQYMVSGGGGYCAGGTGDSISLAGSSVGITYQLYNGTTPVGFAAWGTGSGLDLGVHAAIGTYSVKATNPVTSCASNMLNTVMVTVDPIVTPAVAISSDRGLVICATDTATFTANPTYGGSMPTYEWYLNGVLMATGASYQIDTLKMADVVSVIMTSDEHCATSTTAKNKVVVTINPKGTPVVTLSEDPGATVCPGAPVTVTASASSFGGSAPTYKWKINSGAFVAGGVSTTYKPANNDVVTVQMTSNDPCRLPGTDSVTASVTLKTQTLVAPTFTITATPTGSLVIGQSDTIKVTVTANGGPNPTFQWIVNSTPIPNATSSTFISDRLFNKDSVACEVTGSGVCGGLTSSKYVIMNVRNLAASQLSATTADVRVVPNPNKGLFSIVGNIGENNEEVTLDITNMIGQTVYSNKFSTRNGRLDEQVQLNNSIANGMYLLNVHTIQGNFVFHFVIEQ